MNHYYKQSSEGVSAILHPFPAGVDTTDLEVCKAHVAKYPQWVLALAVVGWGGTTFVSAWVATRLGAGRRPAHGLAIGLLLVVAAAFNMYLLPYPMWFEILSLLVLPLATLWAVKIGHTSKQ